MMIAAPISLEAPRETTACRLCGASTHACFRATLLRRYDVGYFRCPACDLIQTERPFWLDEAYASAICAADTGAIARNRLTCELTTLVAWLLRVKPLSRCLDFGGGHGVFVRMMRDRGFNFRLFDKYAENLFARGFEGDPTASYDLVTAFEVLEHFDDVAGGLSAVFGSRPKFVLAGTMLHRGDDPGWWYYSPGTGQHVAFYSARTMRHVGARFGYSAAGSRAYTLFIRNDVPISAWRRGIVQRLVRKSKGNATSMAAAALALIGPRRPALTASDSAAVAAGAVA